MRSLLGAALARVSLAWYGNLHLSSLTWASHGKALEPNDVRARTISYCSLLGDCNGQCLLTVESPTGQISEHLVP